VSASFARALKSSVFGTRVAEKEFAMLVLSRKVGETVLVPTLGVTLTVLSIEGRRVRLGIAAPADMAIHRQEVWERLQRAPEPGSAVLASRR
jgi:carbon storage regulator